MARKKKSPTAQARQADADKRREAIAAAGGAARYGLVAGSGRHTSRPHAADRGACRGTAAARAVREG